MDKKLFMSREEFIASIKRGDKLEITIGDTSDSNLIFGDCEPPISMEVKKGGEK